MSNTNYLNEHGYTDSDGDFVSTEKLKEAFDNGYVKECDNGRKVYDPDTGTEYSTSDGRKW